MAREIMRRKKGRQMMCGAGKNKEKDRLCLASKLVYRDGPCG